MPAKSRNWGPQPVEGKLGEQRALPVVVLVLTLGAAAAEWAAKGVQLWSPSNSGATKLVSMKTSASGEYEGSWKNQEWDIRGSCIDQA
jgi:hypothetical protein